MPLKGSIIVSPSNLSIALVEEEKNFSLKWREWFMREKLATPCNSILNSNLFWLVRKDSLSIHDIKTFFPNFFLILIL